MNFSGDQTYRTNFRDYFKLRLVDIRFGLLRCFKMKVFAFLLINVVLVESIVVVNAIRVKPFPSTFNVLIEVVGNYLDEYIRHKTSELSIATASSSVQQRYLCEDLIGKLIKSRKLSNFSRSFLSEVDQTRHGNKQPFNLIFVDGSGALV